MVGDHLKDGRFTNFGCGLVRRIKIPLGYFAVDDPRNLYGRENRLVTANQLTDTRLLEQLQPEVPLAA